MKQSYFNFELRKRENGAPRSQGAPFPTEDNPYQNCPESGGLVAAAAKPFIALGRGFIDHRIRIGGIGHDKA